MTNKDIEITHDHGKLETKHDEINRTLTLLVDTGQVFEIRALKLGGKRTNTGSGYFDNINQAINAIWKYTRNPNTPAFYLTLNPIKSELLARCANRFTEYAEHTTGDDGILCRSRILIDFDPIRASGISSSNVEHDAALQRAAECRDWLSGQGWPMPLLADSGNGAHLVYRIDLPNDRETKGLIDATLKALAQRFSHGGVDLDTAVGNASRLTKLYGTITRKGDHTNDRPHRISRILEAPDQLSTVSVDQLSAVAAEYLKPPRHTVSSQLEHRAMGDFWQNVNQAALANLTAWVPVLFPKAKVYQNGYRVASQHLNRDLEEDLGLQPNGIRDFGTERGHDPITVVIEFGGVSKQSDAAHWLCGQMGIDPVTLGWKCKTKRAKQKTNTNKASELSSLASNETRTAIENDEGLMSQASLLINIAKSASLFYDAEGNGYATIEINGHKENHRIRSRPFKDWLRHRFYHSQAKVPGDQAMQDTINMIDGKARFEGELQQVFVRVAEIDGAVYLDLLNSSWEVVEITAQSWRVIDNPPVKFIRYKGMLELPRPIKGGKLADLWQFVNVKDDEQKILILAWLVACFRPTGPFPVLCLQGEQGSAKSTATRILRALTDPHKVMLRTIPRDERDLVIGASRNHVVAFDNLSGCPMWLSDALCRLATGGGFATRQLFTDDDELLIDVCRPTILNGISDVALRDDLIDRAIIVQLSKIDTVCTERELNRRFNQAIPRLLGALLDTVCTALSRVDSISLPTLPRMADFAEWAVAAEPSLGCKSGAFMDAYSKARSNAVDNVLEGNLVFQALEALKDSRRSETWTGSATELYTVLSGYVDDKDLKRFPKSSRSLRSSILRITPALRQRGITVDYDSSHRRPSDRRKLVAIELSARVDGCPSTSVSQVNGHDSGSPLNAQSADSQESTIDVEPKNTPWGVSPAPGSVTSS